MKKGNVSLCAAAVALAVLIGAPAYAGDAVKASVQIPSGQLVPIITENGNAYSQGTYAVGTIQLLYTVNAYQFPVGSFASFDLSMEIATYKTNPATTYPATVRLDQVGGTSIVLTPDTTVFPVGGTSWTQTTRFQISISEGVPDADGTTLVGNLRIAANNHLDTVTNVQVKILLVHPTACVRFYHFITDQAFAEIVTATDVNVTKKGKIASTNPYGQFSDNLLVVNTCAVDQTFDLGMALDPWFATTPNGNPGNAVFTYSKTGAVDPGTFDILAFGTGTPQGQSLCLQNTTVEAGDAFLASVHMGINNGLPSAGLGTSGIFSFPGQLFAPASGCAGSFALPVISNPATATLSYTVK
jgi:opacity protein-like surface antigen